MFSFTPAAVVFPKEEELSTPEIKQVLQYRLENSSSLDDVYSLATTLLAKQEWGFVLDVCKFSQTRIDNLDKARKTRQQRLAEISRLKNQLIPVHDKACLSFEEELFNGLPAYLTLSEQQLQDYKYQFAEHMTKAALTRKSVNLAIIYRQRQVGLVDDNEIDKPVIDVIDEAVSFLSSADKLLELCRVIDSSGSPKLALPVAKKAYDIQMMVRQKLRERTKLQAFVNLTTQERERHKRLKKDLSAERLSELATQHQKLATFEMPFTGTCNNSDINSMEQQVLQIALVMLACLLDVKKNLTAKRGEVLQKAAILTKAEQDMINDPEYLSKMAQEVLKWAIPDRVRDPAHMMQIVKNTELENQTEFIFDLGRQIRQSILRLQDQIKVTAQKKARLQELSKKREEQLTQWKFLEDAEVKELWDLEFEEFVDRVMSPSYNSATKDKLEVLEKSVLTWILDCIYNEKQDLEEKVANPRKYPMFKQLSADELAAKRAFYSEQALRVTNDLESKHVQTRRDSDAVFKVGNKCQSIIKHIENLRSVRAPLQRELNALLAEKADLLRRKRDWPNEKQTQITELEGKIAQLPAWPESAKLFDHHQYDELNLDIVRVMTSAILDNKTTLEEDIARMFRETAPENIDYQKIDRDRTTIQTKIQQLTKQCLTQFSNPVYLLRFAKDMKNRKETEVVLEVVGKCLEKIKAINALRKVRKPIQLQVDELEKEKEDPKKAPFTKEAELAQLKEELAALPTWPHFANIYDEGQHSKTVSQCINVVLNSALDQREEFEDKVLKDLYENKKAVDPAKVAEDRKQKQDQINQALEACYEHVRDPNDLKLLIDSMYERKEAEVMLHLVKHSLGCFDECHKSVIEHDTFFHKANILDEEDRLLHLTKKSISDVLKEELAVLQAAVKKVEEGERWRKEWTLVGLDASKDNILTQLMYATFDMKKRLLAKIENNDDLPNDRKEYYLSLIDCCVKEASTLLLELDNPQSIYQVVTDLSHKKEWKLALSIGHSCFAKIGTLRAVKDEYANLIRERDLLLEEEKTLAKVFHPLPADKKETLRKLEFEYRSYLQKPDYYQPSKNIEDVALSLATSLVNICISKAQHEKEASGMQVENNEENEELRETVILALDHIQSISHLISFTEALRKTNQWAMVILSGKQCQTKIFEQKQEYEERERLKKDFERLDNMRLTYLFKKEDNEGSEEVMQQLSETQALLAKLPKIEDLQAQINARNAELLRVVELVIEAAKIEDLDDELRDQMILAFKTDTTTARWDQIRQIVSEEEWLRIKEDLVVYVIQQDTNTAEKIELLLKDGLYKQVLEVFPKPTGDEKELDVLLRVYKAIESTEPELLEHVIPIVGTYMKHYFVKQNYEAVYPLLDRFQRRFPSLVVNLFDRACEMVMFNIMQSQYAKFVKMLAALKARMEEISRRDDWNDFFQEFKKKHKGKAKLIQMVSLIGDSVWDLDAIMKGPPKKKVKTEKGARAADSDVTPPMTPSKKPAKSKAKRGAPKRRK